MNDEQLNKQAREQLEPLREHLALLAESERQRRPVLLFSACAVYCRVLPGFKDEYLKAGLSDDEAFPGPAVMELLNRTAPEWQRLTGLPVLAGDVDDWHLAATRAGIGGAETLADIESGEQAAMNRVLRAIIAHVKNQRQHANQAQQGSIPRDAVRPDSKGKQRATWLGKALLLKRDHPEWSNAKIAEEVGVHPSTLSRSPEYRTVAAMAQENRGTVRNGYVTIDPETKTRDVVAYSPIPVGDNQGHPDRGQPIPGSKLYREYCSDCGEPMRVPRDQVGQNAVCERCET